VDKRVDNVKDCHSDQHMGTLTLLEFEARFVPTQKRFGVFPKWDKFLRSFALLRMTLKSALFVLFHFKKANLI